MKNATPKKMAERTPNMEPTSANALAPDDDTEVLWAMDYEPMRPGGPTWPVRAHKIVRRNRAGTQDEVRLTACGLSLDATNHPQGWWQMAYGALPLQPQHIHCGIERIT
jgi:hypothetical protein